MLITFSETRLMSHLTFSSSIGIFYLVKSNNMHLIINNVIVQILFLDGTYLGATKVFKLETITR